ncbi:YadA family autotransporter adhesin, partial [Luteimonas panaciterrae]|uniref:YadA family autotransporter adhesin n=1 Tax=Luteimonas panaciterrae TaxID=363885 RepID=UPI001CFAD882
GMESVAAGENSFAAGTGARAEGKDAIAIGHLSQAQAEGSVALGAGSVASRANTVSVGAAGSERQITNVAAGTENTDAVNVAQLNEVTGNVTKLADGAVLYDDDSKEKVTFGGEGGTRLSNVAAGSVATDSMDAINGGQLYGALDSIAQVLGGGATVTTAFGAISAPTYVIQGSSYFNVGDALGALDAEISLVNHRVDGIEGSALFARDPRVAVDGNPAGGDDAVVDKSTGAIAVGSNAKASADGSVAVGRNAYAHGPRDTAVGDGATVGADGSTAVGAGASVAPVATNAVALGAGSRVSAASGTAVGQGAVVTAKGAVAIGQGSVADRTGTVSVGSKGGERQIVNVAAGTQDTDAANVAQLRSTATRAVTESKAYTDQKFALWEDRFTDFSTSVDDRFRDVNRRIDRQGAMGAAMLNMATSAAGIRTQNRVGVGVGFQGGESALSIGYQRAISDRATVTFGGAISGGEGSVGVGAGFGW